VISIFQPEWSVEQDPDRQENTPHLWIVFFTILALATLYLIGALTPHGQCVESASTLEPHFSLPGGYYDRDIQLKISAPNPNVSVIFTVDGSVPTHTVGTVYTQPIRISAATPAVTVIRARAVLPGAKLGPVVSASYFVGVSASLPMISLIMDPRDVWDPQRGIYANPLERGEMWERPVDVTYVDIDRRSGFQVPAGIRIHGGWSRNFDKQSFRLYFRQEYGLSRLEYPLFAGSEVRSFKRLVLHSGGQDWHAFPHMNYANWTLIRNQLAANLALQLDGYAAHSQPALMFINGEPWGIYQIRERIDDRFLADHYGIESADFLETPELLGFREVRMGDGEHWDHLLHFVETHDLADPANYAYVESQIDVANFIDYNILQIYAADSDWPHHNVYQIRPRVQGGRWHWMFWDSDHGFGANLDGQVSTNTIGRVLDHDYPTTFGRDALLLRKMLGNPEFVGRFLSRTADLLNTTLAPRSVIAHIDALAAELEPDIAYETIRWSSSVNWASNIQALRSFARSRPNFVRQHIVERLNLSGTVQLSFDPPVSGSGYVAVNGTLVQNMPWQGVYFRGIPVQVMAAPMPGYRFAGWDRPDLPQTPIITLTVDAAQTIAPRFEMVESDVPRPGDVIVSRYHFEDDSRIEGDRFELLVTRPGGVDLRGWRITDNDTKTATDEGSLIFTDHPAFARVPRDTAILVNLSSSLLGRTGKRAQDDLSAWDRRMVLYTNNPNLNADVDPGFNLGPNDNLVLLAPGPTEAFGDDQGIAFVAEGTSVTQASFGVLTDGVLPAPITVESQSGQHTQDQRSTWFFVLTGLMVLCFSAGRTVERIH
jgi:hypothetical protein